MSHTYEDIISVQNILAAWREFLKGKRKKRDVQEFQYRLLDEIFLLHYKLKEKIYRHGKYQAFNISDPKPRKIHKAKVRDRLLHHAIYRQLYSFFDRTFIYDSYSCRVGKGTHKAMNRLQAMTYKVGRNNTCSVWVLKCDVKKFFASIDQKILLSIVKQYITDDDIVWLIDQVISSFNSSKPGKGLPLGNLTSQLLVNIYMNEFDQFVKHNLKARYYVRYADDFVILSNDKKWLEELIPKISLFLRIRLKLTLHPKKVFIKTLASGVDFLGWVYFADHRILRTSTKRRMLRNVKLKSGNLETLISYFGLLRHGNTNGLKGKLISLLPISLPGSV